MHLKNISLELLKPLKSNDDFIIFCDGCQQVIHRKVKYIRSSIKKGKSLAYCNNVCQGKSLTVDKTKTCEYCNTKFEYNFPTQKYCSKSCGNYNRNHTEETKKKISESISSRPRKKKGVPTKRLYKYRYKSKNKRKPKEVVGEFEKLFICKCTNCSFIGSYRKQTRYCKNCSHCYSENGRAKYSFTFNVYDFPDLFDLDFIERVGWRKTKGENININGVSRDHRVSVHEAILNGYDPFYIKHPLNCQIMLHSDNQSKGTQSSITYEDLVHMVDLYDKK